MLMLKATQFPFVIDLACLAARRDYLKLDMWVLERIKSHQVIEPFDHLPFYLYHVTIGAICCCLYQLSCEEGARCSPKFDKGEHCSDTSLFATLYWVSVGDTTDLFCQYYSKSTGYY